MAHTERYRRQPTQQQGKLRIVEGNAIVPLARLHLLLKVPGLADEEVRHRIELVQQDCVRLS